jgi:hypothetical protein
VGAGLEIGRSSRLGPPPIQAGTSPAPIGDAIRQSDCDEILEREEEVTRQIYDLVEIARADRSYVGVRFLDSFVEEYLSRQGRAGLESPAAPSGDGE